ncbi:MAG: hypothetical protein Q7U39_01220 [Nitrospira sp.]|nr:hypothetical protein [Nitrospira sp.]
MTAKAVVLCACCFALAGCGNQDNPVQTVVAHPVKGTDGGRPIGQDDVPVAGRRRYVAFESRAANLTAHDTNGVTDVFVYDNDSKQTVRVSISSSGVQGNGGSFSPALTPDGRVVVFESLASNLVPEDTNRHRDIFVHDRTTGLTARVSVDSRGNQANNFSQASHLSADGRYIVFESLASNLAPGDTNGVIDVFVRDRQTGRTSRVSVGNNGTQANNASVNPTISEDGRYVTFESIATNLLPVTPEQAKQVFVYDLKTGAIQRVPAGSRAAG